MRKIIAALVFFALQGLACAGESRGFDWASRLVDTDFTALPPPPIPSPAQQKAALKADAPSAEWIAAVKKAYLASPQGGLPPAAAAELPAAAAQQLQWDAATYPSKAYKLMVGGRAAFVIENDNPDALYVNIFAPDGVHVAYGGFDENYDFYWLSKAKGPAAFTRR